jgi:hypothetical protein
MADKKYDTIANGSTGTLGTLAATSFDKIKITIADVEYESIEEFLNSVADSFSEAYLSKMILDINAVVQIERDDPSPPPIVQLWEVKGDGGTPPTTSSQNTGLKSPNQMAVGISAVRCDYIGEMRLKQVITPAYDASTPYLEHFYYEGHLEIRGDRKNPDFFWSDEYMDEPENRTYLYMSTNTRTNIIKLIEFVGLGISFVDIKDLETTLR